MAVDLPPHLRARPVPDEPCAAAPGRDEQKAWNCIHAVVQALVACRARRELKGTPRDTPETSFPWG